MNGVYGQRLKELGLMTLGTLLVSMGVYFFKFPNNFSTGGVSGISVILGRLIPSLSPGTLVLIINTALLLLGMAVLGRGFGFMTCYCSLLMSFSTYFLEKIYPMSAPFTQEPLLELLFAVGLPALGSAILFNMNASTGGTDIVAMIFKKYTHLNIGKALMLSDLTIVVCSGLVFGIQTGLFSFLGLLIKSFMVDSVIESINLCKYFTIITTHPDEVCDYIIHTLGRSATTCPVQGAFSHEPRTLVLTVVKRNQAVQLRAFVRKIDSTAFLMITNTSEIIGKGFRGVN